MWFLFDWIFCLHLRYSFVCLFRAYPGYSEVPDKEMMLQIDFRMDLRSRGPVWGPANFSLGLPSDRYAGPACQWSHSHSIPSPDMPDFAVMAATKHTMTWNCAFYWDTEDPILCQCVLVLNCGGDKISVIWSLCLLVTGNLAYVLLFQLYAALEVKYWSPESHLAPNWAILLLSAPTRHRLFSGVCEWRKMEKRK